MSETKRPIMIRAGHASRAARYLNEAERLDADRKALGKQIRELRKKAQEQKDLADSVQV